MTHKKPANDSQPFQEAHDLPVTAAGRSNTVLIPHVMHKQDGFVETAEALVAAIWAATQKAPGHRRVLVLEVEEHRNPEGGLDHDSWRLISQFIPDELTPFLTEFHHPRGGFRMRKPQREDPPACIEWND